MAEFKLGRIKFVWKAGWTTATTYYVDDIVRIGGRTFVCTVGHTSSLDFNTDLEASPTRWNLFSSGTDYKGDWQSSFLYQLNDVVKYGGNLYICTDSHTSASTTSSGAATNPETSTGLEADQSKWTIYIEGLDWKGVWTTNTRYKVNDLVRYGGITYVCNTGHTSALTISDGLELTNSAWTVFNPGIEYKGIWSPSSVRYKVNDVVKYGSGLWICTGSHTSSSSFDSINFQQFAEGSEYEGVWSSAVTYQPGDIVSYGGNQYISLQVHDNEDPATATSYWSLFNEGFDFQGNWSAVTNYRLGQVVRLNGYTYLATANSLNQEPPNTSYWQRLNYGIFWRGEWQNSTAYKAGDAVRFESNTYICLLAHTSADDDSTTTSDALLSPATDTSGTYWNAITLGTETSPLAVTGDLVYFSETGPTRLPIGTNGQVLKVSSEGIPEWSDFWGVDHVYWVTTSGSDVAYPEGGSTLDTAWKTIRYACEQIEKGPRNPNAQHLLELNRVFIQREVTAWIRNQISLSVSPFTGSFDYDEYKCERDVGFIVDRLIWDLGHGGNLKMRAAAQSFVGAFGEEGEFSALSENQTYLTLAAEADEGIAAYTYMKELLQAVLNNEAPDTVYQNVTDDSTAIATQYFNLDRPAEPGTYTVAASLVDIVITALTDQNSDNIPERIVPQNLVKVATGEYRETLPIIVPAYTCILGDELRSTNVGPAGSLVSLDDVKYSSGALGRLETVVAEVILGTDVTESAGNTATQSRVYPFADSVEETTVKQLVRLMQHRIDFSTNLTTMVSITDPTGYNSSYLSGYGDARTLISENREFAKQEIIAFIAANYPSVKYSKTICKRDVGYIIDALIYDLTYGGNSQSLNAALAYFDGPGSSLQIDSSELAATIASYSRLKTILQQIASNTTVTKSSGNTATQWTDTTNLTGGSSASSFIGDNIDLITDILTAGSTNGAPTVTVTSITGGNTAVTGSAHGLNVGDTFTPRSTENGFVSGTKYWVLSTPSGTEFTVSQTFGGSTHTLTNGTSLSIVGDVIDVPPATNGVTTTSTLIGAAQSLDSQQENLVAAATAYIASNFPSLTYNVAKCERDVRLILEAVMFDFMFDTNVQTRNAAYSYMRSSASDVFSLGQKTATRATFTFIKNTIVGDTGTYLNGVSSLALDLNNLMTLLDDIVYGATNEGSICQTEARNADYARLQLERNRDFIVAEIDAWIDATYTDTVTNTAAATDLLTCSDTSWMQRNAAIRFTGTVFGGISTDTTYYIQNVVSSTTFKIATMRNSNTALDLSTGSGSMAVSLFYNSALCLRDVNSYIDAIKHDLKYPGNYSSRYAARYYANAVVGSLEEDMYYLRDATGIRDQTLEGLTGDLLAPNAFGTSRVSAGAYCSLDPGWGPDDFRTWIITRSPYVQGVTTFGTAAVGQKIDGALHNGGNDSIVSNDFTQVISDGIGAWVTNNARAELVSVFTYYAHIGYLAETGGRIRATNGNNSYGDFGAVAEGVDSSETPNTAVVDNQSRFVATADVVVDGAKVLGLEFDNAGSDYTSAEGSFSGQSGTVADAEFDDIRDDGVFQVRLLSTGDDSSGQFGGEGYLTNSNTAQAGTTTSIQIAQTDGELSSAYVGMKIFLDGGTGIGQYGIISTYNSGTKQASVVRESDGVAGWDHVIAGTTIVAPNASTTYIIEPALSFTAPSFTTAASTINTTGVWSKVIYGDTAAVYSAITSGTYSGSTGSGASFTVIRNGSKYSILQVSGGVNYERLETITIDGSALGGTTIVNDLVITITSVNSVTGAITEYDYDGYGFGGVYVAIKGSSSTAAYSYDGINWSSATLPGSSANWTGIAHGIVQDGSTVADISLFLAVASGGTQAAYSDDGINWFPTTLPVSAAWTDIVFGEGRFVVIATDTTIVPITQDGITWDIQGSLNATGFVDIAYGAGKFVVVKTGDTNAVEYSTDGVTWTQDDMPANLQWNGVAYGNNRFVAIAANSNNGAYSLDGAIWITTTIGSADGSTIGGWRQIAYGQGVFMATAFLNSVEDYSYVATSEYGLNWTVNGLPAPENDMSGYNALCFGRPQRTGYWVVIENNSGDYMVRVRTGARAKARCSVADTRIFEVRITDPGSAYDNIPTMTIVDPNNLFEAPHSVRVGKGVLANPSFKNRGTGYQSGDVTITGNGFADNFQPGGIVAVKWLTNEPRAGSNVILGSLPDRTFKLVSVTGLLGVSGSFKAFLQLSPVLEVFEAPAHETSVTTRLRYSQVRMTGHDFLDIGTGSFSDTNYPNTPNQDPNPANETVENGGGRVFFTSTDQDGNFRVGGLFSVEQSTGVATLNADAFNISGLQELSLGEVTLGGGSATITEFSTDPFFTADSDSVIPTQRAIRSYIASQIGGGGASINVNSVTAGAIVISGSTITTLGSARITINATFEFRRGITGLPLAFNYFLL